MVACDLSNRNMDLVRFTLFLFQVSIKPRLFVRECEITGVAHNFGGAKKGLGNL